MHQTPVSVVASTLVQPVIKGRLDIEIAAAANQTAVAGDGKTAPYRRRFPQSPLLETIAEYYSIERHVTVLKVLALGP